MPHKYAMRTTLDINDVLLVEAKRIAAEQHTSLKAVVEDSLRFLVSARQQEKTAVTATWPICIQAKPVAGINLSRTSELMERTEAP